MPFVSRIEDRCQCRTAPNKINELDMQAPQVTLTALEIGVSPRGEALLPRHAPPDRHGKSLR